MMQKTICTRELISNNVENKKLHSIYSDVWFSLNQVLINELIEKTFIEIPLLGKLSIFRYKRKIKLDKNNKPILPIDWIKTRKGWKDGTLNKTKFIYITRNWGITIKWAKPRIKHITAYSFKPSRTNGGKCNIGVYNKLWEFLAKEDTNYLKIPFKN